VRGTVRTFSHASSMRDALLCTGFFIVWYLDEYRDNFDLEARKR
jgi:hypothetical protein